MKYVKLHRKNFKINTDDGKSFFEDVLINLNINDEKWNRIETIEIGVEGILDVYDNENNEICNDIV